MRRPARDPSSGFTLIELMAVVAIVAIIAAIAIPAFMSTSNKAKGKSEVTAMFAELGSKEDSYKNENGVYLAVGACPASVPSADYNATSSCATTWSPLRVQPTENTLRCQYTITTDIAGVTPTVPAGCTMSTSMANPAESWFVITAICDESGDGGTNTTYVTSSLDRSIFCKVNEGS